MVYETFEELYKVHKPSRDNMSKAEYTAYINDCFDTYEHIGFLDAFNSPYTDEGKHNGMRFNVIGRVSENEADLECLPMWNIQFENGETMAAYPEEICKAENK